MRIWMGPSLLQYIDRVSYTAPQKMQLNKDTGLLSERTLKKIVQLVAIINIISNSNSHIDI